MSSPALRPSSQRLSNASAARRRRSTVSGPTTFVGQTTNVRKKVSEQESAEEFAAVVCNIPSKVLANASGRTTQAADSWRVGKRCPSWSSIRNMAQAIPTIAQFVAERVPYQGHADSDAAIVSVLRLLAAQPSADGEVARRICQACGIAP